MDLRVVHHLVQRLNRCPDTPLPVESYTPVLKAFCSEPAFDDFHQPIAILYPVDVAVVSLVIGDLLEAVSNAKAVPKPL